MELTIGNKVINNSTPPLMFAEEGQANQGDVTFGIKMIDNAISASADGIEFQFFTADDMFPRKIDNLYKLYLKNELSTNEIADLICYAKEKKIIIQAACLSPKLIDVCLMSDIDSFCVNATDLTNPYILDPVSSSGKPFWLATLMATYEEIDWAVNYIEKRGVSNFGLLHGQHVMASDENKEVSPTIAQLDCIKDFKKRYDKVTGYVDHTSKIEMPAIAVAKGANLIMKHLAPPTEGWRGPDWVVCLNPSKWKYSRELAAYSFQTGGNSKTLSTDELGDRSKHRRSLYINKDLKKGSVIQRNDLIALRPGEGGLDPRNIDSIIGKVTKDDLHEQKMLQTNDIE